MGQCSCLFVPLCVNKRELRDIPHLPQNSKYLVSDDIEAIWHLVSEGFPLVGQGLPEEPQGRICELLLRGVEVIVGDALMHDGP